MELRRGAKSGPSILFLCDNVKDRGNYIRCRLFGEYLASHGWVVTLIAVGRKNVLFPVRSVDNGVIVIETPFILRRVLRALLFPRILMKGTGNTGFDMIDNLFRIYYCLTQQYEILYSMEYFPNTYYPARVARGRKRFLYVAERLDQYVDGGIYDLFKVPWFKYKWIEMAERRQLRDIDHLVAISTHLADRAVKMGLEKERISVIHGGAAVSTVRRVRRNEARRKLDLPADSQILIFLGAGHTDLELLTDIVDRMEPGKRSNMLLLLVGEETRRSRLLRFRLRKSLDVRLTGRVSDELMVLYLSSADVAVLPLTDNEFNRSRWPHKIGEYIAAGLPVVLNGVGDVAQFIAREEAGVIVDSAEEFARALEHLLEDQDHRAKLSAHALNAARSIDQRIQSEKLKKLLENLLEESSIHDGGQPALRREVSK